MGGVYQLHRGVQQPAPGQLLDGLFLLHLAADRNMRGDRQRMRLGEGEFLFPDRRLGTLGPANGQAQVQARITGALQLRLYPLDIFEVHGRRGRQLLCVAIPEPGAQAAGGQRTQFGLGVFRATQVVRPAVYRGDASMRGLGQAQAYAQFVEFRAEAFADGLLGGEEGRPARHRCTVAQQAVPQVPVAIHKARDQDHFAGIEHLRAVDGQVATHLTDGALVDQYVGLRHVVKGRVHSDHRGIANQQACGRRSRCRCGHAWQNQAGGCTGTQLQQRSAVNEHDVPPGGSRIHVEGLNHCAGTVLQPTLKPFGMSLS
ncbi:hypothetical protein D3C76_785050 [compost metagenome]